MGEGGLPRGRDVEMMEWLAASLGRELQWTRMGFDQLLSALEGPDIDVICATLGVTPERAASVAFTRPYFDTHLAVVVRMGPGEPGALEDLIGLRVAGGLGTTAQRAIETQLPGSTGVFDNEAELTSEERLLEREVDAIVMDAPAARRLVDASGGALMTLRRDLGPERYALVLSQRSDELLKDLNQGLLFLERGGALERLNARYGLSTDPAAR